MRSTSFKAWQYERVRCSDVSALENNIQPIFFSVEGKKEFKRERRREENLAINFEFFSFSFCCIVFSCCRCCSIQRLAKQSYFISNLRIPIIPLPIFYGVSVRLSDPNQKYIRFFGSFSLMMQIYCIQSASSPFAPFHPEIGIAIIINLLCENTNTPYANLRRPKSLKLQLRFASFFPLLVPPVSYGPTILFLFSCCR